MLSAHVGNIVCMAGRQTGGAAAASGVLELDTSDKQRVTVRGAAPTGSPETGHEALAKAAEVKDTAAAGAPA